MKKQMLAAIIALSASVSYGQSLVQFQNGTVADADDVNANFSSLETQITANATATSNITSSPWESVGADIFYTDGKVGIGTNTPVGTLDIFNTSGRFGDGIRFSRETGDFWDIVSGLTTFQLGFNEVELMRVNTNGNVGIGTDTPSVPLHVKGTANDTDGHIIIETFQTSGTARDPKLEFRDAGGERLMILGQQLDGTGLPIHTQLTNFQNGNIEFRNINTELMIITSSGNVGIGNPSPASKLAVSGLPTSPPDSSGNAGIVCATNNGNFWLDNDGVADCL